MKSATLLTLVILVLGCNSNPVGYSGFPTTFSVTDTTGRPASTFHPGDSFDISFAVSNQSGADQSYHYTGVPVVFQIVRGDSVVATSIDGFLFPQVVLGGRLRNGETYSASWRAPNTSARIPHLDLSAGDYEARILHGGFFEQYALPPTPAVPITIVN